MSCQLRPPANPQRFYAGPMSSDSTGAAADLADALDDFTERAAVAGAERAIWLSVGGPHDLEQRTAGCRPTSRTGSPSCSGPSWRT